MAQRERRVFPAELTAFCVEAMRRSGMSEAHARITAAALVTTDSWGVFTHGTRSLRQYLVRVRAGGLRADREPEVVRQAPSWAVVDGHAVMGMVSACFGMGVAVRKARETGIGFVTVRDGSHFGAAGYYALR